MLDRFKNYIIGKFIMNLKRVSRLKYLIIRKLYIFFKLNINSQINYVQRINNSLKVIAFISAL